jgi:quinohemoprotein ethanol dehydrogenase
MRFKLEALAAIVLLSCLATACSKSAGGVDGKQIAAADSNAEWPSTGKGYAEQRFSPLQQVSTTTVGKLGLAWSADFDTDRGQEATPIVADGVLYTTTAWSKVFAFDAKTGKPLWSYDPKVAGKKGFDACCDVVNRGPAIWQGHVFVGTLDGRLIALDAKTGAVAWTAQTTDNSKPYTITGAPRVVKGKVLIGNGGAEYGVRGYISAYDAETGALAWRFYTAPNPNGSPDHAASDKIMAEKAAATWPDGVWKQSGGGATVWDSMAYDPALDLVYFGVGNGSPWNHQLRSGGKGDNLFVSSILALRPDTGEYVWHYQTTPGESWDYTATQHIILADLNINGQPRHVLMQAPKNGFFYVLDRATGALISAKPFAPISWATGVDMKTGRPIETANARYQASAELAHPSPFGAHNWQPMTFSPATGLVYLPVQAVPYAYANAKNFVYRQGGWNTGTDTDVNAVKLPPKQQEAIVSSIGGSLMAWDPVAQAPRWTVKRPYFWNGGVLSTAGGLVFQGAAEGELDAFDATSGAKLWSYPTGNGVIAAPMTYQIDGEQYVAVMVGVGGAGQISYPAMMPKRPRLPGRLMVFKLGGTATAPPFVTNPPPKIDLATLKSTGDAKRGFTLFNANCQVCHGPDVSGAWLPDLKRSTIVASSDDLRSVVVDGALAPHGMASFSRFITAADVEDIRAYIITEAQAAKETPAAAASASASGAK